MRDFLMRVKCGRFPPIEKDFKMVLAHCGSLFLDPAALQLVRRCLFGLLWSVCICVLCAQQPFKQVLAQCGLLCLDPAALQLEAQTFFGLCCFVVGSICMCVAYCFRLGLTGWCSTHRGRGWATICFLQCAAEASAGSPASAAALMALGMTTHPNPHALHLVTPSLCAKPRPVSFLFDPLLSSPACLQTSHELVLLEKLHCTPEFSPGASLNALTKPPLRMY